MYACMMAGCESKLPSTVMCQQVTPEYLSVAPISSMTRWVLEDSS
jgi:hypothetical protein